MQVATAKTNSITADNLVAPAADIRSSLIYVAFLSLLRECVDNLPPLASSNISDPSLRRISVDRPSGHMTTSQPPPLGMINVDC